MKRFRLTAAPSYKFELVGGPFNGHEVWLTGNGSTLTFTVGYKGGKWTGSYKPVENDNYLKWVPT